MSDISIPNSKQLAAATLGDLLALRPPECCIWQIQQDAMIVGRLDGGPTLDSVRLALAQWAAVLDDPVWKCAPWVSDPRRTELSVSGTYHGHRVEIWDLIDTVPGLDVAELSTPPQVDAAPAVRT